MAELIPRVFTQASNEDRAEYTAARNHLALMERGLAELRQDAVRYKAKADIEKLIPFQERAVASAYARLTTLIDQLNEKYVQGAA